MLVRDNTKCPHCGKFTATDVYHRYASISDTHVLFRAECFDCLAWFEVKVDWVVVYGWCRLLAGARGLTGLSLLPNRWSPNYRPELSVGQKRAVVSQLENFFGEGACRLELADSLNLRDISRKLKTSGDLISGATFEDFCHAWCPL
jgi:hypothetical protein